MIDWLRMPQIYLELLFDIIQNLKDDELIKHTRFGVIDETGYYFVIVEWFVRLPHLFRIVESAEQHEQGRRGTIERWSPHLDTRSNPPAFHS